MPVRSNDLPPTKMFSLLSSDIFFGKGRILNLIIKDRAKNASTTAKIIFSARLSFVLKA